MEGKVLTYADIGPDAIRARLAKPVTKSRGVVIPHDRMLFDVIRMGVWEGKTVLVDLDGTLIKTDEVTSTGKREKRTGAGKETHLTTTYGGRRYRFTITEINASAKEALQDMRNWGARIYVTSAADDRYVKKVVQLTGFSEIVDDTYGWDRMVHLMGKRWGVSPKDYRPILEDIGEKNPLSNCAVIGNDLLSDVSVYPKGMVSVICPDMNDLFLYGPMFLNAALEEGMGKFWRGFDYYYGFAPALLRLIGANPDENHMQFMRKDDWEFDKRTTGFARVLYIVPEAVCRARKQVKHESG